MNEITLEENSEIIISNKEGVRETRYLKEKAFFKRGERVENDGDIWNRVYIVEELNPLILQEKPK